MVVRSYSNFREYAIVYIFHIGSLLNINGLVRITASGSLLEAVLVIFVSFGQEPEF